MVWRPAQARIHKPCIFGCTANARMVPEVSGGCWPNASEPDGTLKRISNLQCIERQALQVGDDEISLVTLLMRGYITRLWGCLLDAYRQPIPGVIRVVSAGWS